MRPASFGMFNGTSFLNPRFIKGGEYAHFVHAEDVADAAICFSSRSSQKPRLFFVTLDDDPLNTVANPWSLYRTNATDSCRSLTSPFPHLPVGFIYWLRKISYQAGSNSGSVRYSSKRLASEGARLRIGVREVANQIILDHNQRSLGFGYKGT